VFENRVLRRTLGPKKDEVTREWRKLHNKGLHDLYSSPNNVQVIKSRMRRARHAACRGESTGVYRVLGNLRETDHTEGPGIDGRIILRWIFWKWDVRAWTGSMLLRIWMGCRHS
jgi:hypothetical protein